MSRDILQQDEIYLMLDQIVPGQGQELVGSGQPSWDLYFERMSMAGLPEMHRYSTDERLYRYFEFDVFTSIQQTENYIKKLIDRMGNAVTGRTAMYWFVRRKRDGYLVGTMGLLNIDLGRMSTEWGFGVDPDLWNEGYILQMQEMVKIYVFEVLRLNRLYSITMTTNKHAISSLQLAGLQCEGTLRQYYRSSNLKFHDAYIYAMLESEYFSTQNPANSKNQHDDALWEAEIIKIVSEVLGSKTVNETTHMNDEYKWDSLSHVLIMQRISELTGIQLTPRDIAKATSIKSIVSVLKDR